MTIYTKVELIKLCKQNGIKGYSRLNKNEMIILLLEYFNKKENIDKEDVSKQESNVTNYNTQSITIVINNKSILINFNDICEFYKSSVKSENDKVTKIREAIMNGIINNKMPNEWYNDSRWLNLKTEIITFLQQLHNASILSVECDNKGGCTNNHDFNVTIDGLNNYKFELKCGSRAESILTIPQFIELTDEACKEKYNMFEYSYREYYYDNYLNKYLELDNNLSSLQKPSKEVYLKKVKDNRYTHEFFDKLKQYSTNNETQKKLLVGESISEYIKLYHHTFNFEKLAKKIRESQKDKIYLFWNLHRGKLMCQKVNVDKLTIKHIITESIDDKYFDVLVDNCIDEANFKNNMTNNNYNIRIRLNWGNTNGVANPRWKISYIEPLNYQK